LDAAGVLLAALVSTSLLVWLRGLRGLLRSLAALEEWPQCSRRGRTVSAVIAVRDEERRLPALLDRLLEAGDDRLVEVIVVDDGSRDSTPLLVEEYAARDPRVRLIRSPGPPPGWAPKAYALRLGASAASGEVLLFLDADTRPASGESLVAAAAELAQPGGLVAFVPRFLCRGRLCRAVESYMTGVAHGFYGFHRVRDPRDGLAWMYGCCWAVLRGDYERLGGHEAVRGSLVEDRDFAAYAKSRGYAVVPVDARREVGVESYEDLRGYAMLVARLAADKARSSPATAWAGYVAGVAAVHLAPLAVLAYSAAAGNAVLAALSGAALGAQLLLHAAGARVNLDNPAYGLGGHLGHAASLWGLLLARRGYRWRGRSYGGGSRTSAA